MQTTGVFISFEGIDGAGKSSHIQALSDMFRQHGREVVQTREPGGTALAEKLRDMVLHDAMDPLCEALLVFAARRDHLRQVIEPALAKGQVVLCDRFTDATFAYQGGGRGFDTGILAQLEAWVQARPDKSIRQPDITLWFSLDPHIAAQRLASARVPDRFESQPLTFFEQVHNAYADRVKADPERFAIIQADASVDKVRQSVCQVLVQHGYLPTSAV
ncbi:MAG: dTMP kinase [Limnohabitans sp.]